MVLSEEAVGLALIALGLTIFVLAAALAVLALRLRLTRRELGREVRARRQMEAAVAAGPPEGQALEGEALEGQAVEEQAAQRMGSGATAPDRGLGADAEVAARLEVEAARLEERSAVLEERAAGIADDLATVRSETDHLKRLHRGTLCRVGLIRYDAFENMGGAHSFSAALLDAGGDGIILSAVNGRTEGRMYAKPVVSGGSQHELSDEEKKAIDVAMQGSPGEAPGRRPRRRRGRASA